VDHPNSGQPVQCGHTPAVEAWCPQHRRRGSRSSRRAELPGGHGHAIPSIRRQAALCMRVVRGRRAQCFHCHHLMFQRQDRRGRRLHRFSLAADLLQANVVARRPAAAWRLRGSRAEARQAPLVQQGAATCQDRIKAIAWGNLWRPREATHLVQPENTRESCARRFGVPSTASWLSRRCRSQEGKRQWEDPCS